MKKPQHKGMHFSPNFQIFRYLFSQKSDFLTINRWKRDVLTTYLSQSEITGAGKLCLFCTSDKTRKRCLSAPLNLSYLIIQYYYEKTTVQM